MATTWEPERCCRDSKCPGSWFAVNKMTGHLGDDGTELQGVFPTEQEARDWCARANAEKLSVLDA